MSVEAFLTWLVTVNDLDAIFNDRRGSGSCLKRRLLLVWLIKRVSWFYIWFLIAVSLCTCRRSNEDFFESPRPSLAKEGSTFSPSPSSSGSGDVTALRCSEPLRYKVGGASKPSPWLCGMGQPYYSLLIGTARIVPHCSIALHLSSLEWGILFILLLIGLPYLLFFFYVHNTLNGTLTEIVWVWL